MRSITIYDSDDIKKSEFIAVCPKTILVRLSNDEHVFVNHNDYNQVINGHNQIEFAPVVVENYNEIHECIERRIFLRKLS